MKLRAMALFATAVLAACSNGLGPPGTRSEFFAIASPFVPGPPPPAGTCTALIVSDPQLALINPAGGGGIPVTLGSITFSAGGLYYSLALVPNDGSPLVVGGTITGAGSGRYTSRLPVLKSGVTYMVEIFPAAGFPCAYVPGSFTTL